MARARLRHRPSEQGRRVARIDGGTCSENRHGAHSTESAQRPQPGCKPHRAAVITIAIVVRTAFIGIGIALALSGASTKPWINTPNTNDETSLNSGG